MTLEEASAEIINLKENLIALTAIVDDNKQVSDKTFEQHANRITDLEIFKDSQEVTNEQVQSDLARFTGADLVRRDEFEEFKAEVEAHFANVIDEMPLTLTLSVGRSSVVGRDRTGETS